MDPVAYAFSHPEAKRVLRVVLEESGMGLEQVRGRAGIDHPEAFRRVLRKLAQFDLLAVHAPPGAKFKNRRIPMVVEPTAKTAKMVRVLRRLDQVVVESNSILGQHTVERLAVL